MTDKQPLQRVVRSYLDCTVRSLSQQGRRNPEGTSHICVLTFSVAGTWRQQEKRECFSVSSSYWVKQCETRLIVSHSKADINLNIIKHLNHTCCSVKEKLLLLKWNIFSVPLDFCQICSWVQQHHKVQQLSEQRLLLHTVVSTCCFHQDGVYHNNTPSLTESSPPVRQDIWECIDTSW